MPLAGKGLPSDLADNAVALPVFLKSVAPADVLQCLSAGMRKAIPR